MNTKTLKYRQFFDPTVGRKIVLCGGLAFVNLQQARETFKGYTLVRQKATRSTRIFS